MPSAVTVRRERFSWLALSIQESSERRPVKKTGEPFFKNSSQTSASLAQAVTSTKTTSFLVSPLSVFHSRLTASPICATAVPLGVWRHSGSRVR